MTENIFFAGKTEKPVEMFLFNGTNCPYDIKLFITIYNNTTNTFSFLYNNTKIYKKKLIFY